MPTVPIVPGVSPGIAPPSEANQLMALADMHRSGALEDAPRTMPKGPAELGLGTKKGKPFSQHRRLKVIK